MKKSIFLLLAAILCAIASPVWAATKTIYCKMTHSWWTVGDDTGPAAVGAYYWDPTAAPAWPGVRMTPVDGEDGMWSIDIDTEKYTKIIFTRVNSSGDVANWGAQTGNLDIPTDEKNLFTITTSTPTWGGNPGCTGTWSVYTPGAEKIYKNITITVTANSTPQIHYWGGGDKMTGSVWENLPTMTATANANEYTYTINDVDESEGVNYLLKIGDIQTADQYTTENVTADFKDLLVEVKVQGIDGWQGGIKMTPSDDYLSASVTYPLGANLSVDLKLTVGGDWFGDTKNAITKENNSTVFDSNGNNGSIKTDISGDYVFTYTYATKTLTVTYPTEEVEVEVNCYVIGNENLTGVHWVVPGEIEMTKDEETGLYTHTFTSCPANTPFEMQVYYANTYKGFNCLSDIAEGITANGDNICFTLVEAGDVTVTYNAETDKIAITSTVDFVAPEQVDNVTLYFVNYDGWTDIKAHVWNAENNQPLKSWDNSDSMTDTEIDHNGFDVYSYEFPETYNRIIFKGNGQQTGDEVATYNVEKPYYCQGVWYATLDEIPAAVDKKCYLMGIGGDWTTGIEMEEDGDQFKLLCQPIAEGEQFKFKYGDTWTTDVENYDANGVEWVETEPGSGQYNITLPAGNYNFYYKKANNQVYIEAATDCETEPEYSVVEDEITNFVFDMEAWPMVCMGGPSTGYQIEVYLTLTEDVDGTLAYEDCSVSIMGTDATFIDGTLSNIDPYAPYADAVLHVQWGEDYYELQIAMSSTPAEPITIEAEDATVTLTEYPTNHEGTEFAYELAMVAEWVNEAESLPYTVEFVIPTFDPTKASGEYNANFYVTGEGAAFGMNEGVLVTVTKDGNNVTLTGNVSALNSNAYNVTISGTIPTELATITLTTGNNDDVIAANIGKTVNVKIERSFTANDGFYTLCVPFNMPASVIGKAYSLGTITKHVTDESIDIELEETYELSAGVPYLVLPKANMSELVVENVTIQSDPASGQNITKSELNVQIFFEGFYSASGQTNGTTQYYVGNNGYLYNEVVDIRGLSGLFTINDANGAPFEVRARVVTREDEATGFENITNGENTTIKLIENGQLIIIRGGEKFNAQGQKL